MHEHHDYEKLDAGHLEEVESAQDSLYIDEVERLQGGEVQKTRVQKIIRYVFRHGRLLSAATTFFIVAAGCVAFASRISRARASSDDEGKIMNLLVLEDDPTLHYPNPPHPDGMLTNFTTFCGNTPRMAQSRGCIFDVMSFAWVPAHCVDVAMMERYISERTWEWYADYDLTQHMSVDVVRKGEYKWMFSTQSYHIAHCVYTWEKQKRFLFAEKREDEKWVDQGSFVAHHTTHCIDYILKRDVDPTKVSTIWNGVAECRAADTMGTLK